MIILLDIGNSRIKWGWLDECGLHVGLALATDGDFIAGLSAAWGGLTVPERVLVSNVAHAELGQQLQRWLQANFGISAEFITSSARAYGVSNSYAQPERLGCDRWLALIALRHGWQGVTCVLDAGTAVTFDLLDETGRHQGGAIIPGLELMARSLIANTAQITESKATGIRWLGNNTADAIQLGALNAVAGMAERLRQQACHMLEKPVTGILTGGNATSLAAYLGADWQIVPDLLLRGLAIIAQGES